MSLLPRFKNLLYICALLTIDEFVIMRYFLLMILALLTLPSMAQSNRIYIEDFELGPDSTVTVPVMLANEEPTRGIQFNMTLPQGLTLKNAKKTDYSKEYDMTLTCRFNAAEGCYMVFVYPMTAVCYDPGTTAVISMKFTAEGDFKGGNINLWKCRGSTMDNHSFVIDDATTIVTVPAVPFTQGLVGEP